MNETQYISQNKARNEKYTSILEKSRKGEVTVKKIASFGGKMMRKDKVHYHFFENHSLYKNALYLTFFSLKLPYEYKNSQYLDKKITDSEALEILKLFEMRISERIPVEYITHESYYLGFKYYVNKNVLVPRSLMHNQFDEFLAKVNWENYRVLDMCTGSGCVGITLALLNPKIKVDLVDISPQALEVANINIKNHQLEDRVRCIQSDLFENIHDKYDLIISAPPYVTEYEYKHQPQEVKNEPKLALTAGEDGLDIVNRLLAQSKQHLNPNGLLITEVGYTAATNLKRKYPRLPFKWYKCRSTLGYESMTDWLLPIIEFMIRWTGYLDSIFICEAKGLPENF